MISKVYDEYKSKILDSLSKNKILNTTTLPLYINEENFPKIRDLDITENVLPYDDKDKYKKLSDPTLRNPSLKVGEYLVYEDDGETIGSDLILDSFFNHKLCGKLENSSLYTKDVYDIYDIDGSKTLAKSGLIVYSYLDFPGDKSGLSVNSRSNIGTFFIDEVDDDGIVVLPPKCSGLCILDDLIVSKIKKIISISPTQLYPHLFGLKYNKYISEISIYDLSFYDVSHISYEVYSNRDIDISNYGSYAHYKYENANGGPVFQFKELQLNLNLSRDCLEENINLSNIPVVLNLKGDVLKYILLRELRVCGINVNNLTNNDVCLYISDSYGYINDIDLNLSNIKNLILKKEKDFIGLLERISYNLNPNINFYFFTNIKLNLFKDISNFDKYCDIVSYFKANNINFYTSSTSIDITSNNINKIMDSSDYFSSHDSNYLLESYLLNYLSSSYGSYFIDDELLKNLKYKDVFYDFLCKLFGKCDSTFGSLDFNEARERFCDHDLNIFFKSFNLYTGTIGIECGAGVTATLNLIQIYLLRLFGLSSYQYISLKSSNKYSNIYNVENGQTRYRKELSGCECLVFSDKLNNRFSDDDLEDLAVVSFLDFNSSTYSGYQSLYINEYENKDKGIETSYKILVYLGKTDGSGDYNYSYLDKYNRYRYSGLDAKLSDSVYLMYRSDETTWKVMNACIKYSKQALIAYQQTLNLLSFVKNSKSCGLYGGIELECLKSVRNTNSQLPKDLIMDKASSNIDYSVFTVKRVDTGDILNIEGKTLYNLLHNGDVVSSNLNHTLIENEVVWLQNDYDKKVTSDIEAMLGAKTLFTGDDGSSEVDYGLSFSSGGLANSFLMHFYNIGNELLLPSYITYAYEETSKKYSIVNKFGEDSWTDIEHVGIEVGNEKEVDVTYKINSLLKDETGKTDTRCINNPSIARKNNVSFYCGEKAVYKNNRPLVIESVIANKLLELPRKISINFCYDYKVCGLDSEYSHDVKIVVRDSSTIYAITCATEIDIAENCLIHSSAFAHSRVKKCVIHGGSIPRLCFYNCKDFEELVIDGGNVAIDISAFHYCFNFKGITVLNGGSYTIINSDSSVAIEEIRNSDDINIPFYGELVNSYDEKQKLDNNQVDDVIPHTINPDMTVELISINGNRYSLSIERILYLYENGLLNFSHVHENQTYDYIEELEYSKLKCLVFSRETRNALCASKVLLLLEPSKVKRIVPLKERKLIFAYQKSDWLNGNITEVPLNYLSSEYKSGILFDNEYINNKDSSSKSQDAIVYHFWQNLSYYQIYHWSDLDSYYQGSRSNKYLRPADGECFYYTYRSVHVNKYDTLYLPASHEYSWYYKMMDKNLVGSSDVLIGGLSRYGRLMHNKRYVLPNANKVVLIPGIGENCLLHISKAKQSSGHYKNTLLWNSCKYLEIRTPTVIESNALIYFTNYSDDILSYYDKSLSSLDIYADTKMAFLSVLFDKCVVHNSSLVIDCENIKYSNRIEQTLDKEVYIEFDGDCKFQVNGLDKIQIRFLILAGYNNLAYQLLVNSDTMDSLLELFDVKEFYDKCKSGAIKVKRAVKKPVRYKGDIVVKATPYVKSKLNSNYKCIFEDDIDEEESVATPEEVIEESLSNGVIPDMLTLDYIEEKINEIDPDVYKEILNSDDITEDIDFMNLDIKSSVDSLIDMCNIDVDKLSSDAVKEINDYSLTNEELYAVEEVLSESNKKEAEKVRDEINNRIKEDSELLDKVRFTAIELDESRRRRKQRIEARKKYDLEKNPLSDTIVSIKRKESDSILNKESEVNSDIFNEEISSNFVPIPKDNSSHVIDNNYKKSKGLASSILSDILKTYQDKMKPELIDLEILNPIYKHDVIIGYEVLNLDSKQKKRLSLDNIKKLRDSGKYNIVNIENIVL